MNKFSGGQVGKGEEEPTPDDATSFIGYRQVMYVCFDASNAAPGNEFQNSVI